jgi:hypothetical protein
LLNSLPCLFTWTWPLATLELSFFKIDDVIRWCHFVHLNLTVGNPWTLLFLNWWCHSMTLFYFVHLGVDILRPMGCIEVGSHSELGTKQILSTNHITWPLIVDSSAQLGRYGNRAKVECFCHLRYSSWRCMSGLF